MIFLLLSYVLFIFPVSIFGDIQNNEVLLYFAIIFQLLAVITNLKEKNSFSIKSLVFLLGAGLVMISTFTIGFIKAIYLTTLVFIASMLDRKVFIKSLNYLLITLVFLLVYQAIFYGFEYWPNSTKTIIIFNNPNVFWYHIAYVIVAYTVIYGRFNFLIFASYIFFHFMLGGSRSALVIICLLYLLILLKNERHLLQVGVYISTTFFIVLVLVVRAFPEESYIFFMEYNELLNGRPQLAFRNVGDTEYFSGAISDTPILDTALSGSIILLILGLLLMLYTSSSQIMFIIFITSMILDSTLYAPIISLITFFCLYEDRIEQEQGDIKIVK